MRTLRVAGWKLENRMFIIGDAIIEDDVIRSSFCCDVHQCRGACCCIEGGRGAPLENDEVQEIERAFPHVKRFLTERSLQTIHDHGLYEGRVDDFATPCNSGMECVFAYFDNGIARCSFERAFEEGLTGWKKPLSCHLFPIRIKKFGKDFVRYEQIDECRAGRQRGAVEQTPLVEFLREPLTRKYGTTWYASLHSHCGDAPHGQESAEPEIC